MRCGVVVRSSLVEGGWGEEWMNEENLLMNTV